MVMLSAHNGDDDLTAYFDESGTDRPKSSAVTVAGYISTVKQWEDFQVEWQKMLNDEHLDFFHMVDAQAVPYEAKSGLRRKKGWDKQRSVAVVKRAHDIIRRYTLKDFDLYCTT